MAKRRSHNGNKQHTKDTITDIGKLISRVVSINGDLESLRDESRLHECMKALRKNFAKDYKEINIIKFKQQLVQAIQEEFEKQSTPHVEIHRESKKKQNSENTDEQKSKKRQREDDFKERVKEALRKKRKSYIEVERPSVRFEDLGGMDSILQDVRNLAIRPFLHPEVYRALGVEPAHGILLHGPPGCGKTMLAHAIAGELGVPFIKIAAPEIVSGMSGQSESKIRSLFKDAVENAPCIIFIDEIDAITRKRDSSNREMEVRIVAQLISCMDGITFEKTGGKMVLVIGATNRPDSLDPALRRAGRFDREITLGMPDEKARQKILEVHTRKLKCGKLDFVKLAKMTPGFVGADLHSLASEAASIAIDRIFRQYSNLTNQLPPKSPKIEDEIEKMRLRSPSPVENSESQEERKSFPPEVLANLSIEMSDFEQAVDKVQPSAMREGFVTIPDVTFNDIGALEDVREELRLSIVEPIKFPEHFQKLGLVAPCGVLLYGPPGCGKTLLAKAIANECRANFISVKGPELLNKYVGESERAVRLIYQRARASSPCIIFFDELDSLCPRRGADGSNSATERVVNQLLTEMDGIEGRKGVFVIGATNRPDIIDPAMLRPGRLDKLLCVPLPDEEARVKILKAVGKKTPMDSSVNLKEIAKRCENFSGADLGSLVREAAICCYKELQQKYSKNGDDMDVDMDMESETVAVNIRHFEQAFEKVKPSVTEKDRRMYEKMNNKLKNINEKKIYKMKLLVTFGGKQKVIGLVTLTYSELKQTIEERFKKPVRAIYLKNGGIIEDDGDVELLSSEDELQIK